MGEVVGLPRNAAPPSRAARRAVQYNPGCAAYGIGKVCPNLTFPRVSATVSLILGAAPIPGDQMGGISGIDGKFDTSGRWRKFDSRTLSAGCRVSVGPFRHISVTPLSTFPI